MAKKVNLEYINPYHLIEKLSSEVAQLEEENKKLKEELKEKEKKK